LTAKNPISAVEITAERTIRPSRMAISIELPGLGTGHLHSRLANGGQKAAAGSRAGETHGGDTEIDAKDFGGD
jgi:hypothetical protein